MSVPGDPLQARVDAFIAELAGSTDEDQALHAVAVLALRSASDLHRRARALANAHRGEESWGARAGLQNAARTLVLQASTCRDTAAALRPPED